MKNVKILIVGLAAVIFVYVFFSKVLICNPTDTTSKFNMMKSDMDYMLGVGGDVVFKKDLDRGSVASLMRNISAKSWSRELFEKYQLSLRARGWKDIRGDSGNWQACKLGVLVTLDMNSSLFPALGEQTYGIRFEYSAGSIRQCGRSS
ncbi:hypothetical protein [Paraburkholderia ferrariae]|uniref:Uncharacterized protein n=1 Tax=Paraburkholderia ferrariae TaxID=386056 RepID=A0ABU9RXW9_9BURK